MPQDFLIFEKPKKYSHHNQRFTKKGNNKQYLMREVAEPTKEAKVNAETIFFDQDCVTIYVDASELNYQGIFGLGVCMVGFGETFVVKKKVSM